MKALQVFVPETPVPPMVEHNLLQELSVLVGQEMRDDFDVAKVVELGVDTGMLERLVDAGLSRGELEFVIPAAHPVPSHQEGTDAEHRGVRTGRARGQAAVVGGRELFGDKDAAAQWLRKPLHRFEGKSPLDMAHTEPGARLVEQLIAQANEGYAA
ncbi:MbcA/ParS/Xre antitoxin family protein [Chromobacterium haemolyticum]|nr:MbcA/ParS/Xre antitoxin family protein [Chromobacterium haemolyticum]